MKKICVVGATGVGKTILASFAARRTGLPLLESPSRAALTSPETRAMAAAVFTDLDAADALQKLIWAQLRANEAAAVAAHGGFVSDRSLDVIAYTADQSRVCWELARTDEFENYLADFRSGGRIVFFVRPERKVVKEAADGVRDPWLSWACVNRIDGILQYVLESNAIRYVPVCGDRLRDRYRLIESVLRLAGAVK